jgi:hypothetical protein
VRRPSPRRIFVLGVSLLCSTLSGRAFASERFALIVTGASGGPEFATKYNEWRSSFSAILRARFGYPDNHVVVLAEQEQPGVGKATRENVRAALAGFRQRVGKDDVLLILLIGHGTGTGAEDAKFNLVGPDLSVTEWSDLIRPISGRIVFIDAASGSYPFIQKLSGHGRIILAASNSIAQQSEIAFPGYLVKAFTDPDADVDKNGRVSIWEAFTYASRAVLKSFEDNGRLPTERALLDDTGQGIGREAQAPGADGVLAQITYLQPDPPIPAGADSELTALLKRRAEVETAIDLLKARRAELTPAQYDAELEKLLLDLARIDSQIRLKSKS